MTNRHSTPLASPGQRPFRFWMTGSRAVVMSSLCTGRGVVDDERLANSMRVLRSSPFGVAETVARIEAEARQRGQPVMVRVDGGRAGNSPVLVLASSAGTTTPVVMISANSLPDIVLGVQVRRSTAEDGRSEVLASQFLDADWDDLPEPLAEELAALPELVARALA